MRNGLSLIEILVAAVILVVVGIPLLGIFTSTRQSLARTDRRREIRHLTDTILAHAARQPLHDLWDEFGPGEVVGFDTAGRMRHRIADFDERTGEITGSNPLGFEREFLKEMVALGLDARLHFEFYSRDELGLNVSRKPKKASDADADPNDPNTVRTTVAGPPAMGILHMQAGYARVDILDREILKSSRGKTEKALVGRWAQPLMCPAVVGRPGLKLASCPAVNPKVRAKYVPMLAMREGFED